MNMTEVDHTTNTVTEHQLKEHNVQLALSRFFEQKKQNTTTGLKISACEAMHASHFIGDFSLPLKNESWSDPAAVFYEPSPDLEKGHSCYFALIVKDSVISTPEKPDYQIYIASAKFLEEKVLVGAYEVIEPDKEYEGLQHPQYNVVYSTHRHDYQATTYGTMLDGGFDYVKTNTKNLFKFKFIDGHPMFQGFFEEKSKC
jgi:hypothetical protein